MPDIKSSIIQVQMGLDAKIRLLHCELEFVGLSCRIATLLVEIRLRTSNLF